jgi:hypothetical protein
MGMLVGIVPGDFLEKEGWVQQKRNLEFEYTIIRHIYQLTFPLSISAKFSCTHGFGVYGRTLI